jgi:pimeloyl-ACP methyl ester carboxylesterase
MTDAHITESRLAVNGIALNVAIAGPPDGPPVVLLHGFPDRWQLWRHQVPALAAAGYRVIAPDLRGFGASDRPAEVSAYAMPTLVGDVIGLLDALEVPTAAVVGHDWGAGLAWSAAMARPERVDKLTVISVGHGGTAAAAGLRQREMSWYMLWFLFPGVAEQVLPRADWAFYRRWAWGGAAPGTDADADRQVADLTRPGALTAGLNWYRANIRPDRFVPPENLVGPLPRVSCPTMGVWSAEDGALGEVQMTASSAFVDAPWRYERIEGCDHWVPLHAPDRLTALLLDFLDPTG